MSGEGEVDGLGVAVEEGGGEVDGVKRAEDFFKARKELNATLYFSLGREPGPIDDAFHQFKQALTRTPPKR